MKADVLAYPFTYWVGMDTDPRTTPEALAEFNRFYSTTHVGEVIAAHPGFVSATRYELVDPDSRGDGPRWLAIYAMVDEASAEQYLKDNARPWLHRRRYSPWPAARRRAKTVWRMIWRQVADTRQADDPPETLRFLGLNAAPDAEPRAVQLAVYRSFAHPEPGCPAYCTIAAADGDADAAASDSAERVWRLTYRRLPPPTEA